MNHITDSILDETEYIHKCIDRSRYFFFIYRSSSSLRFDLYSRTLIIVIVFFSTEHRVFAKCTYSVVLLKVSVSTSTSTSISASVSGMHLQSRPRPVGCTFLSFIQSAAVLVVPHHSYLYTHSTLYRPNNFSSSLQLIRPIV